MSETRWLIEDNDYKNNGHRWLRAIRPGATKPVDLIWHDCADLALAFCREEDARNFIFLHKDFCVDCRPTSHTFGIGSSHDHQ